MKKNNYYYAIFWLNFDNFRGIFVSDKEYKNSSDICKQWTEQSNSDDHYSSFIAFDATGDTVVSYSVDT
jgi:hypothetical protein